MVPPGVVQKKRPSEQPGNEYSEDDDFIDDTEEATSQDYSSVIRDIFGYDRRKYVLCSTFTRLELN